MKLQIFYLYLLLHVTASLNASSSYNMNPPSEKKQSGENSNSPRGVAENSFSRNNSEVEPKITDELPNIQVLSIYNMLNLNKSRLDIDAIKAQFTPSTKEKASN